ncbi:MFS transporter [bacterium (candidate division B38) B3_B38]|nr:MAG: MFS transporter [bacterium (candidate division B38) B3_B38]
MVKRVFLVLFMAVFVSMIGIGLIIPLLPIYAESLGARGVWLGVIFSGFSISRAFFMPLIGRWSDRKGRRIFIALGLFLYAVISLGFIVARNVGELTAVRLIQGFAAAMTVPVAMAYIGELSPKEREGYYMGSFNIALYAGFGFGPFMGGILEQYFSINANFYAMGGLSFLSFLLVIFFLPELHLYKRKESVRPTLYRDILRSNTMKGLTTFRIANSFGRGVNACFIPILAHNYLRLTSTQIGLLVSANLLLTAFLQGSFGWLADRVSRKKLVILGSLIASFALFMVPLAGSFSILLIINSIMGVAGAIALPSATALTVTEGRNFGMGSTMGIFNMAMSIGLAGGPMVGGVIYDYLNIPAVYCFAGLFGLIGTAFFIWFVRPITGR